MQWSIFCSDISGVANVRAGRLSNGGGERRRRNGEWACIGVSGAGGSVWSMCHTDGRGAGGKSGSGKAFERLRQWAARFRCAWVSWTVLERVPHWVVTDAVRAEAQTAMESANAVVDLLQRHQRRRQRASRAAQQRRRRAEAEKR